MYKSWRWVFSIQCSCGLCLLVWKMFVKKREFGRREREEGRRVGRGMQMRPALEKVLGGTKAFIVRSLLPYSSDQPTIRRSEWPVWALKRGFVGIQPDFNSVFTINFQTPKVPRVLHAIRPSVTAGWLRLLFGIFNLKSGLYQKRLSDTVYGEF